MMTSKGGLRLERSGPLCLLVNLGEDGRQHLGMPPGGAADEHAYLWANKLLGNDHNAFALELTLGPFSFTCTKPTRIALSGAARSMTINQASLSTWQSADLNEGDHIAIDAPKHGLRTYLAVEGGFAAREKSTVLKNDTLDFAAKASTARQKRSPTTRTPHWFIPDYRGALSLGVILNPRCDVFSEDYLFEFFKREYMIDSASNRMAYRLRCESDHRSAPRTSLFSQGVPFGSIQMPASGEPIVLLKDRQTIGGYPVLGFVAQRDCFRLSQKTAGEKIRFYQTSLREAQADLMRFYGFLL